jgi:hypothetical protein
VALTSNIAVTVTIVLINKKIFDELAFPGAVTARCEAVTDPLQSLLYTGLYTGLYRFQANAMQSHLSPLEPSHLHCAIVHAIPASRGDAHPKPSLPLLVHTRLAVCISC